MIITTINKANEAVFGYLIAPEVKAHLFDEGTMAIGAIYEDGGIKSAAGAIVFSIDEGASDGEVLSAGVIKWLFVDEKWRSHKVADRLVCEAIRVVGLAGVENLICDLPMPQEYDEVCGYLESIGFEFSLVERPELDTTLQALYARPAFKKQPEPGACEPLSRLDPSSFSQLIKKLRQQYDAPDDLSTHKESYDQKLSCVWQQDKGALLVRFIPEFGLELVHVKALEQPQRCMADMTRFAVNAARDIFPADTPLLVTCRSQAGAAVIDKLFPGAQPRLVRRGYLSIYDFLQEAESDE